MKKLLTSLLAILMVLSLLAACRREEEKAEEKKEPVTEEQGKPVEEKEEEKSPKDFTLGKVDGQTYENAFIKIGCRMPENWKYLTLEAQSVANGIDEDLTGDALLEAYLEKDMFVDLTVSDGQGSSCSISMEKMDNKQLEELDVLEYYEEQLAALEAAFVEIVGAEKTTIGVEKVMLDGVVFDCIYMNITANGIKMVQYMIAIKCDGYLANLALATIDEEKMEGILDCFYLLK